jgi:hypothetical protein
MSSKTVRIFHLANESLESLGAPMPTFLARRYGSQLRRQSLFFRSPADTIFPTWVWVNRVGSAPRRRQSCIPHARRSH